MKQSLAGGRGVSLIEEAADLNDDGRLNLNDLIELAQHIANWQNLNIKTLAADVDGNKVVDLNDVTDLAQYLAGWNVKLGEDMMDYTSGLTGVVNKKVTNYVSSDGLKMPYTLLVPKNYNKNKEYPVVMFFHGADAKGTCNVKPIQKLQPFYDTDAKTMSEAIVLIPQCVNKEDAATIKIFAMTANTFAEDIARQVKKLNPKTKVGMFAYSFYDGVPDQKVKFPGNMYLSYCYLVYAAKDLEAEKVINDKLLALSATGAKVVGREYWGTHYTMNYPLNHSRKIDRNLKTLYKGKAAGIYGEPGSSFGSRGSDHYILSKLAWDPTLKREDILKDFCSIEFRKFFFALMPLLPVQFKIQFFQLPPGNIHTIIIQKIGCDPVDIIIALIGQNVDNGSIDIKKQAFDHFIFSSNILLLHKQAVSGNHHPNMNSWRSAVTLYPYKMVHDV